MTVVLLAWSAAAAAQAPTAATPFVTPQRDVDVTYFIAAPGGAVAKPLLQRMRWSAGLWRQRLDPPGAVSMITDYRSGKLLVLDSASRSALQFPAPGNGVLPPGVRATGAYARVGDAVVAGTPCTEWRTADDAGAASLVCFTSDGVMLRARRGSQTLIEAARVLYTTQDPALFSVPPGTAIHIPASR